MAREIIGAVLIIASMDCLCYALGTIVAVIYNRISNKRKSHRR